MESISEKKKKRKLRRIMMRHENEKREAQSKALQNIKDTESLKTRNRQKLAIISLALVVLAILGIAWIQWRNNQAKQKANKLLENTLSDLKSVQTQLIQSEKLASLGELTAGI